MRLGAEGSILTCIPVTHKRLVVLSHICEVRGNDDMSANHRIQKVGKKVASVRADMIREPTAMAVFTIRSLAPLQFSAPHLDR